jgi:uncharacterized protein (TIGR00369 family)
MSTGLERMRAIVDGSDEPPPMATLMGFKLIEVEEGRAVFSVVPGKQHYNPLGMVHGGLALTLLDSALGVAVHTTLAEGASYSTLETKVNLVRPITADTGELRAEGRVVHRGRTTATAEGRFTGVADGKLYAHGTSTCLILTPPG